jgi:hypothetical protein
MLHLNHFCDPRFKHEIILSFCTGKTKYEGGWNSKARKRTFFNACSAVDNPKGSRDTLLPKLISGERRISDTERIVERMVQVKGSGQRGQSGYSGHRLQNIFR